MIPKKIHQCWFGDSDIKPQFQKYIEGIKKIMPDYDYKLWTNKDLPNTKFVRECLKFKKYALLSDYMRMKILEEMGGFYLDTDVEVLKRFDDFLNNDNLIGYECEVGFPRPISNAIIGCKEHSMFIKENLESFVKSLNNRIKPYYGVKTINLWLIEHGLNMHDFVEQKIEFGLDQNKESILILPRNVLHPKLDENIPDSAYTIHHLEGSWHSKNNTKWARLKKSFAYRSYRAVALIISALFPHFRYK